MKEPFGASIFCDDIRFELLNKVSLIGTYGYELLVFGTFPVILPKLGIFISIRFPRSQNVNGLDVLVYFPGDSEDAPSHSQHFDVRLNGDMFPVPAPSEYPDTAEYLGFNCPVLFSPAVIKETGYIRVRVVAGEQRIKVGSLRIREASPEERQSLAAPQSN